MSLLQEYVKKHGTDGLNKKYVDQSLANGGGNGATAAGIYSPSLVDNNFITSFLSETRRYMQDAESDFGSVGYKNASSLYSSHFDRLNDLKKRRDAISMYLKGNKDKFDEEFYNTFTSDLDLYGSAFEEYQSAFKSASDFYSQFDTEQDYNDYVAAEEDRKQKLSFDLSAGKKELDDLYAQRDEERQIQNRINGLEWQVNEGDGSEATQMALEKLRAQLNQYGDLDSIITQKEQYYNQAKHLQSGEKLKADAVNAADFEEFAKKGADIKNPTMEEAERGFQVFGWKPFAEQVGNEVTYSRENYEELGLAEMMGTVGMEGKSLYHYMTDEEVKIYNYYLAKEGKDKADEYLYSIEESLNARQGGVLADSAAGNLALQYLLGAAAGLDQFASGVKSIFSDEDYINTSAMQFTSGMVREDLSETGPKVLGSSLGQVGYDLINTTANMAPSILASTIISTVATPVAGAAFGTAVGETIGATAGKVVGAGLLGASAGGNAYAEKLNAGYSKDQAAAYGMMVAASEAGLEYLIGGISKMGGKLTGKSIEAIANNIDNAVGRVAAKWGMSMLAEGTEEYLQDVLNPWYENIVFNMNNDVTLLSEDALYSGLLGALSAGVLEGRSTISADRAMTRYGESLKKDGLSVERLKSLGQTFAADTVAYELAGKVDENTGAYTIARLFNEVNAQLSEQNKADIVKSLERKGYATKHAEIIANQLAAAVDGAEFGALQRYVLDHNEDIAKTFADVILNPNSTVNQRRVQSATSLFELAKEVDKARVQAKYAPTSPVMKSAEQYDADAKTAATNSSATLAPPERFRSSIEINFDEGIPASPEALARSIAESRRVSPVEQMAAGLAAAEKKAMGGLTVSKSGKVEHKPTGKEIGKLTIVSDKDKKLKLKTESGEIVDAKDVNFRSKDEAMVYSAVLGMGVNPVVAQSIVDNFDGTDGMVYAADVKLAYQFGKMNFPKSYLDKLDIKPYQAEHAYKLGRSDAKVAKSKTGRSTQYKRGSLVYEYDVDESTLTPMQKVGIDGLKMLADLSSVRFHIFESTMTEDGYRFTKPDGTVTGANGWYLEGTNDIWVDINSGNFGQGLMMHTVAHEISHYIKEWSPAKWQAMADFLLEQYGEKGVPVHILLERQMQKVKRRNPSLKGNALMDAAYEELVSDALSEMLVDGRVAEKMQALKKKDAALWEKIKESIKDLLDRWGIIRKEYKGVTPEAAEAQFLHDMDEAFSKLQDMFAEAFADADANFSAAEDLSTDTQPVETSVKHSFRSLAEAAGFGAMELEDGTKVFLRDRQRVSRVTLEDIENSPIGAMINFSVDMKDITTNDADRQKKMFRDFCNMAIKTGDFNMTMQFAGSAVFTGMKANADKQYGTTYDFPSICTKTQAVIDAMSARMVKLGRGLSSDEIVDIYRKVFASGNPVPCPECYVFSRWIGIGGLLDNIKTYQDTYGKMSVEEAAAAYDKLHKQIEEIAKEKCISFGKAKGKLASDLQKEYNKLKERIEKNQNQGEKVKPSDAKRLADLEPMMTTVKALTWLENVYFADEKHTKVNKNFRVPDNVLFDLNNGEAFATQYKEAWAFRTTQGAGYGKAITPYAEARLGEGILVTNNTANAIKGKAKGTLKNYFLDQKGRMDDKAVAALKKARAKQKNQAFIGGQRFQSTSDARYENASDYLLAALEMQAMGGMVQVYTKVDGAVPAFSAWGFSINQSLMPLGGGLDANGNVKDTSTGGMNPDVAFRNREKHETAGTITIGVNDNHIRKMFAQWERDFIIPYHASGGKATIVAEFRDIQEKREAKGAKVRSTDYSRTQSDKVLSDEVLRWMGRTEDEIRQIHAVRDARIAILTGKSPNMDVVRGNRFLSNLYDKLRTKDGEWYGVVLAKGNVEGQIFPNEFWDQSVSYEDSAKITEDYLAYCKDLGILHRFSGMVPQNGILRPVTGYNERGERVQLTDLAYKYKDGEKTAEVEPFFWKVLTDRRMYDNSKKYLPQKRVTLNDTTTDTVATFATGNYGRQYNKELSQETAAKLADAKLSTRDADGDYDIKLSDRDEESFKAYAKTINEVVTKAINNKGNIGERFNQKRISAVIPETAAMVARASGGQIDITGKHIAINGDDVWHEYRRHSDVSDERSRDQIPLTKRRIVNAIKCIYKPDIVECLLPKSVSGTVRRSFAYAKRTERGHYIVVEAVGGRHNPNIIPVQIMEISRNKWKRWIGQGKTLGEMLYEGSPEVLAELDTAFNKKNRVIAAQFASDEAIANTPHSPRFDTTVTQPEDGVKGKNSDRDSLTPEQQKHFDYNQKQETVGSTLKTLKGSDIKRSTKYGVGKEIGGEIYFHKEYAEDILPAEVLSQAERLLEENHPGFEYNCLKYNPKTGVVAFQEAPDFDTAREPVVGDYVSVNTDTGVVKTGHSNYIWHHKWNWVKNDYSGFDVEESWNWSKEWLSTLTEVSDGNGIERWNAQLDKFGLPKDGEEVLYSDRDQEYDSKDTSVKILPATFTKFGLKPTDRVLDWGGGQYDIAKKAVENGYPGIKFEVVDAFNRTETHNDRILAEYKADPATVLTINNVLNVIKETKIIEDVIRESKEYLAADGVCYIKIYEGNDVDGKTGNGKVTSSGWQNNQPAEWYRQFAEKYYQHVERVGDILIASDKPIDRKSLPKVDKDVAGAMRGKVKEIAKSEASMRESLYSDRDIDSVSNRDILANAFMDVAQDDVERGKIAEYQQNIKALDEDERKLRDIRAQLHDLSFSAGPRDNAKIRELREKATKLANRIGIQDKQLLRLEASKPLMAVLEREKKLAYSRASQKWEDRIETARTGRSKTEMRHKIKKIVGELNNLLLHGTKDKHIMIGLQKATAEALSAINMDTVAAEKRLAKIQAKIDKATDPAEKARLQQSYARVEAMGDNMATRLTALKNAYEEIKDSGDPLVANAYQPEIEERIKNLRKMVGDTPLRNMSMEQLEFTYDTYKMVLTTIRNANKAFKNERGESIAVLGNRCMEEIGRVGGKKELVASAMRGPLGFVWSGMKPTYAFKAIGSDTLSELFSQVRAGEDVWATDVNDAKEFYSQKTKQYNYDSWDLEKEYTFTSKSGKEFKLTLEQIMSLYAYSKRKQADAHLEKGGFVFDSSIEVVKRSKLGIPVKYRVNTAHAHALSRDTLMEICKTLTDEQVKFVDEMQGYLSTVMGEKGNEVSLKMYGVKLFKEKFYFPLKSAKQFMYEQYEVAGDRKIKNSGFSNDTTPHASNPVILNNFTDVWATHVNDMAMYHAFVLPMEDFERVFNYKTPTSDTMPTESVKGYLQDAYGVHPEQYIKQLMTDLNGGARIDPTAGIINKGIALFKKSAVFASLSVVIQQPSAIARAMAYIDAKYFVGKPGLKDWDEVKKYAPVAIIKEMGYFDTNMGKSTVEFIKAKEYTGVKSKMKALVTDRQYRDEILSKAPSVADELAWCQIWNAVKKEIAETKKLQGEELLQAAGKRFTEVIVNTQVYDSVLTRSGMMRSKDTGMKMATSFMAEPTTSLNMIADALIQGKRGNKSYARKAIGAVAASMILNSILVSFVYAGRDDDEDKTYIEKYAGSLTSELIDSFNPLTLIPFVKDIVSIAQGYDVERSDMAVITDLFNAWKKLSNDNLSVYRKVEGFGGAIASIFGLPLKNIMRDVRGIYNTVKSAVAGPDTTGRGMLDAAKESLPKWMGGGERSNADQLYAAMLSGDTGHVERLKARFKDDRAFTYAVRDGLVNNDKRITAAAEARAAGNQTEYMRLAREIVNEGHFSQDDVVRAVNYVLNSLTKKESEPAEATKPDTFKIDEYLSEALSGDQAEAELVKREIIAGHVADGKTEDEALKSFNDSFKNTAVKGAFTDGDITMDVAIAMLRQYGGVESADAYADVQYWQFKKEHPDIYVADGWFDSYYMDAEGSGISIDVYMQYRNAKKGVEGKANIMRVIDSMPLSSAQKDALYFGEGWASSTLHEAPWR